MLIKIKIYGKLQDDKETVELSQKIGHYFKLARIKIDDIEYNLFTDEVKKEIYVSKIKPEEIA
uniref:Uncharacterized protein n=1 Tax=viral metagenome TaxID=1070528 RepID=A0A6M3LVK0_9ZZZZ